MEIHMRGGVVTLFALTIVGCASMTPTVTTQEAYAIYDIKAPTVRPAALGDAITQALQRNMTGVRVNKEIPPAPLPSTPERFALKDLFKNSAFAAAAGIKYKLPSCEGAMLTLNANNQTMAKYGENTTFFACVQPYADGYWLTVYSTFSKTTGGANPTILGADLARAFIGDSSQFIPRTVNDVIAAIKGTGATVSVVDAYP